MQNDCVLAKSKQFQRTAFYLNKNMISRIRFESYKNLAIVRRNIYNINVLKQNKVFRKLIYKSKK